MVWDKKKNDLLKDQHEVNRLLWEEYRLFTNPHEHPNKAAQELGAKLKMKAKQMAPYEEYLKQHGICSAGPKRGWQMARRTHALFRMGSRRTASINTGWRSLAIKG
ncbi:hypothetical protein, partial [Neobacillus sp. 19]|uniref:hypothetical protein n=1 Tax=Neobacillus sp. 19 TaxID=3394458 RepID=UPI003C2AE691